MSGRGHIDAREGARPAPGPEDSERRIAELTQGLEAVRPVPRLRTVALWMGIAWAVGFAIDVAFGGAPLKLLGLAWREPVFVFAMGASACVALGALLAATSGAVPGREGPGRVGGRLVAAGAVLSLAAAFVAPSLSIAASGDALVGSAGCIGRSVALGLLPMLVALGFAGFAYPLRPARVAGLAVLGAVSLGAVAVHWSCGASEAMHLWVGHGVGPWLGALLLALPLALAGRVLAARRTLRA